MAIRRVFAHLLFIFVCFTLTQAKAFAGDDWKPIDPAHVSLNAPLVEKDADAEAIFWEIRINDAGQDLIFQHYIRIKVFTERGKESQSKIDIEYLGRNKITTSPGAPSSPTAQLSS